MYKYGSILFMKQLESFEGITVTRVDNVGGVHFIPLDRVHADSADEFPSEYESLLGDDRDFNSSEFNHLGAVNVARAAKASQNNFNPVRIRHGHPANPDKTRK
jgi:hypothetical protein